MWRFILWTWRKTRPWSTTEKLEGPNDWWNMLMGQRKKCTKLIRKCCHNTEMKVLIIFGKKKNIVMTQTSDNGQYPESQSLYYTFCHVISCIRCSSAPLCSTVINQTQLKRGSGPQADKPLSHSTIHTPICKNGGGLRRELHKPRSTASFHSTSINN